MVYGRARSSPLRPAGATRSPASGSGSRRSASRPWQGQVEETPPEQRPAYDPACYLCPGNARAGGARNPAYTGTFVFENDFAALRPTTAPQELARAVDDQPLLLHAESERGICRVVCFAPRHALTLAGMDLPALERVVATWTAQYRCPRPTVCPLAGKSVISQRNFSPSHWRPTTTTD